MAKVVVKTSFIGTPDEVEKYGGQVSASMAHLEDRMSEGERASYNGKINAGTEMEVSDARAKELLDAGLIEGDKPKKEKAEKKGAQVLTTEKVKKAGETKKAETKGIPTAKK